MKVVETSIFSKLLLKQKPLFVFIYIVLIIFTVYQIKKNTINSSFKILLMFKTFLHTKKSIKEKLIVLCCCNVCLTVYCIYLFNSAYIFASSKYFTS